MACIEAQQRSVPRGAVHYGVLSVRSQPFMYTGAHIRGRLVGVTGTSNPNRLL